MTIEQRNAVKCEARLDAVSFVDEFSEALDPAATDWDGEAWAIACSKLSLPKADIDALWPVYQGELVAATRYLNDGHELLTHGVGADHNLT